jgi:hypothetical protein
MASELLREHYPNQRPIRPHHVQYLRYLMRVGHFRQGSEIHLAELGQKRWLLNGYHTLTAIVLERQPVWLSITTYRCTQPDEISRLYDSFDRNLQRSLADMYHADPLLGAEEWSRRQITQLGGAMLPLALGFQSEVFGRSIYTLMLRDAILRLTLMHSWLPEARNAFAGLQGKPQLRAALLRAAVIAVILSTYRYQAEKAHQFWPEVARNSGLKVGQPAHLLVHFLLTTTARQLEPTLYARHVAACWNAYVDDREIHRIAARTMTQPMLLLGTPHSGDRVMQYLDQAGQVHERPVQREMPLEKVEDQDDV